jgi:hypothetical protein
VTHHLNNGTQKRHQKRLNDYRKLNVAFRWPGCLHLSYRGRRLSNHFKTHRWFPWPRWPLFPVSPTNVSEEHRPAVSVFSPEDGDSIFLRNVGTYLQVHTALQPTRPTSTSLLPWEVITHICVHLQPILKYRPHIRKEGLSEDMKSLIEPKTSSCRD